MSDIYSAALSLLGGFAKSGQQLKTIYDWEDGALNTYTKGRQVVIDVPLEFYGSILKARLVFGWAWFYSTAAGLNARYINFVDSDWVPEIAHVTEIGNESRGDEVFIYASDGQAADGPGKSWLYPNQMRVGFYQGSDNDYRRLFYFAAGMRL